MSEQAYGFTEGAARKTASAVRRLAQIPYGQGAGIDDSPEVGQRDWCWFKYGEFFRQVGTAGDSIAPDYPSTLQDGSSNPGAGYLYFNECFGDHRNIGVQFVRQDAYGNPWLKIKRSGLFNFDMTLSGNYSTYLSMANQTGVTETASSHAHSILNYYDTSRLSNAALEIMMQRRTSSGGAWGAVDNWTMRHGFLGNIFFNAVSQVMRFQGLVHLTAGWDIRLKAEVVNTFGGRNSFVINQQLSRMMVEYLGPGSPTIKQLTDYEVSP